MPYYRVSWDISDFGEEDVEAANEEEAINKVEAFISPSIDSTAEEITEEEYEG